MRLDAQGQLLGQWRLEESDLSIRHLARGADGTIGVALQAQRTTGVEQAAVLAVFDENALRLAERPKAALRGYGGDIACVDGPAGSLFAVGCTHGDRIAVWSTRATLSGSCIWGRAPLVTWARSTPLQKLEVPTRPTW